MVGVAKDDQEKEDQLGEDREKEDQLGEDRSKEDQLGEGTYNWITHHLKRYIVIYLNGYPGIFQNISI